MKKYSVFGKWLLACSLGVGAVSLGGVVPPQHVYAEQTLTQADYENKSKEFMNLVEKEDWASLYSLFNQTLQKYVSQEHLPHLLPGMTAAYGKINKVELQATESNSLYTTVKMLVTAEQGPYVFVLHFDQKGKVNDFTITMATDPNQFRNPEYNHPEKYIEKPIVFGEKPFQLPGVLTVPKGEGPFPVVVLVHGSGAHDKDETIFTMKPFRDLAVGLANHGIAVLRYDKRTYTHAVKSSMDPKFSIMEETVIDANHAVEKLKSLPEIDGENIFVLGHSQGAYALPLILENDKKKDIKGAIGVAGPVGKFHELLLWQIEEGLERAKKMNAPQEQIAAIQEQLDWMQAQAALLEDPQYSQDNLPAEFGLSNPYWWFDLKEYEPAERMAEQDVPLLLLQGGKDIQVPAEHLDQWKEVLKEPDNVQYQLYPNMMHMLADYAGEPDGMTEYYTPGNVAEAMIDDVAAWVKTGKLNDSVDLTVYKDYQPNQFWSEPFAWAINKGIIKGYEDEKVLRPYKPMRESEYLRVFLRNQLGSDLKDESLANIYGLAKEYGLPVKGDGDITRGEAAVLLAKSFTGKTLNEEKAVQWLYDEGIVDGYPDEKGNVQKTYESYKPDEPMKRSHLVTMLYRIQQ